MSVSNESDFEIIGAVTEPERAAAESGHGYFFDALSRFKKNKSSVAAAFIIGFLILFAIVSPVVSPYKITDKDSVYTDFPPYIEGVPMFNGSVVYDSVNPARLAYLEGIHAETGMNPVIKILEENITTTNYRGEEKTDITYKICVNRYFETGILLRTMSYSEFSDIQRFQNETGIQVIYPYVKSGDIMGITGSPNIWYKVIDKNGTPEKDADGNLIPAYSTDKSYEGAPYDSIRIAGDKGDYIYSAKKAGGVECRICYYNYYKYRNGMAPTYILGTNSLGQDLFSAIGLGARFSLIFALIVSVINMLIGVSYGAVQGYFGGAVDLALDRVADLLSGMPFIVVTTLFTLHLANKVGPVVSFLFAFVLTGWISMAALTRKQFYRFKGREYVLAARTLGVKDFRLMTKHILPNAAGTLTTGFALVIPGVINSETTLTYLGIINLSEFTGTTLGTLMAQGQTSMTTSPHSMLFPALYFSLLMISFNLFGNGLRDAFNPSTKGEA